MGILYVGPQTEPVPTMFPILCSPLYPENNLKYEIFRYFLKIITKLLKSTTYADDANTDAVAIADNDADAAANNDVTSNDNAVNDFWCQCCWRWAMMLYDADDTNVFIDADDDTDAVAICWQWWWQCCCQ